MPLDSSLLADLRDVQDDMDDEETYDALMKVLNTFDVVPAFETNRPTVDARLDYVGDEDSGEIRGTVPRRRS